MKIRFLNIYFFILLASCFLLFVPQGHAQEVSSLGLSVSPQVFEIDVFPGEKIEEKIDLINLSKVPVPILVKTTDFTALDDSGEMEFDESLQDISIASRKWFEIKEPNFILEADEKKEINFLINIPENAEPGGHYSVILFEPQLPSFYFKPGQPRTIPVIGVLFLISVKTLNLEPVSADKPVEIVEFKIPREEKIYNVEKALASIYQVIPGVQAAEINIVSKTPSSFLLRIKNNDIFHHKLSGKLLIYNIFGKRVGETEIKRTTILPGKIRQFPVDVARETPENLKWLPAAISNFLIQNTSLGKYKVVLELGEENSQINLNEAITFWALPWQIILLVLLLMISIILTRKRLVRVIKIMFSSKLKAQD